MCIRDSHRALALQLGAVTDAHNIQLALPARGHAMNRIEDQRPCQPMHRGVLVRVANDMQFRADCFQRNALGDQRRNLALGPLDQNSICLLYTSSRES